MVEMLFYLSIFAIFSVVLINVLIVMTRSFRETAVFADLVKGSAIMERMAREVSQSPGIVSISSTDLKLYVGDLPTANNTIEFLLSGSDVVLEEDDVAVGNLNSPNVSVSNLLFTEITTTEGKAVKIEYTISSNRDPQARVYNFYDTVILRGIY